MYKNRRILLCFIVIVFLTIVGLSACNMDNTPQKEQDYIYTKLDISDAEAPTVFMQFYDWFEENGWVEEEFVDKIDWEAIGIYDADRESEEFYYKMFSYIESLGVDAISWEYHPRNGVEALYPKENAINALKRTNLKIACFYDLEIAIKLYYDQDPIATLSQDGAIAPDETTVNLILEDLKTYYEHVPEELWAYDKEGRHIIYVYGYDFNTSVENMEQWDYFADAVISGVKEFLGEEPCFYWTCKNAPFAEHLFQHYSDNFVPFQFVLDTPQSQFSSSSVTWNIGYDNLGVQVRDKLQRVIRLDERYIKEMGWLSAATDCDAVFIYGWNEPWEGSLVIPTEEWGDTKAQLVKQYIECLKSGKEKQLKKTLLIVDDLDTYYLNGQSDWHYGIEREMLLYAMRRYLPQADVYMLTNVTEELLEKYECIVDISVDKNSEVNCLLKKYLDEKQILVFDPKAGFTDNEFTDIFVVDREYLNFNSELEVVGTAIKNFVRDDLVSGKKTKNTTSLLKLQTETKKVDAILVRDNDIWTSLYGNNDEIMRIIFEEFYKTEMNISIMYGEGFYSQRLEINEMGGEIVKNTLQEYSINQYWEIPGNINWRVMPEGIDDSYYDFIFGIE